VSLEELMFRNVMPRLAQLQYAVAADQFLIVELLQALARTNPNPGQYLDALYERVLTRWEESDITPEQSKMDAMFREALNKRIIEARNALRSHADA
jgi:hypothetical protein